MEKRMKFVVLGLILLVNCKGPLGTNADKDWPVYGGNNEGSRYSTLSQIDTSNVKDLKVAWMYNAADLDSSRRARQIECQPIVVDGILYGTSPEIQLFALKAATGEQLWIFNPKAKAQGYNSGNRGVSYWQSGDDKRILFVAGFNLFSIDATTGQPDKNFGVDGKVDLHVGLENDRYDIQDFAVGATSPGVVYKDILVLGSTVSEQGDALPGHIRGFNIRTGKLVWVFHTIPQPGEVGYDTWPKDAYKKFGGANNWGGMALDEERGIVYLGTGSPSVDFYGGDRAGANLFSDCILALDAETGDLKWYYQAVHHDLWDYDFPCPPNLVTVKHNGKMVDAVVQAGKDGTIYVLDRDNGTSLFPVEERPVPTDGLPGEHPYPTQKFPLKPAPSSRQFLTEADLPDSSLFPESYEFSKKWFLQARHNKKFIPQSLDGIIYIGISGGSEWGGNAVDPDGILYLNSSESPWEVSMVPKNTKKMSRPAAAGNRENILLGKSLFQNKCFACHGQALVNIGKRLSADNIKSILETGRGRMPSFQNMISKSDRDAIVSFLMSNDNQIMDEHSNRSSMAKGDKDFPYYPPYNRGRSGEFNDANGYPAIKPPWGTLNAIDLNTGDYVWRVPLGEYDELTKKGIPVTGTKNTGGLLVTDGGLIFISGTEDEKFRAFDKKTGKVVWEYQLPAGAWATPITYQIDGKQYIAIAAGGVRGRHKPGGYYIAFALP